jgi:hypothetical protein
VTASPFSITETTDDDGPRASEGGYRRGGDTLRQGEGRHQRAAKARERPEHRARMFAAAPQPCTCRLGDGVRGGAHAYDQEDRRAQGNRKAEQLAGVGAEQAGQRGTCAEHTDAKAKQ